MDPATAPDKPSRAGDDPFGLCGHCIDDKYRIDAVVGRGGYGVVYRGVHTGFGEPIAVKCLKLPGELEDTKRDALLERLRAEGRVLHRLSRLSSGIVQALDVGAVTAPGGQWVPYLVLEWLEGETLAEHLRRRRQDSAKPLSLDQTLELLEPVARALSVAHRQKVAHRDVKPENLYLTEVAGQRTVKVLDFGIAKVLSQHATFTAAPAATQKQASAFTPSYGAPEQFNKRRGATGPWTDVFALALIMVECVSGERALQGDDATQLYIAAADPASRPTLRYHGVESSDAVERVLCQALAVEPGDRYQDALVFWTALSEAAGLPVPAPRIATDISDTGEFISHHDIEVDAGAPPSAHPAGASAGRGGDADRAAARSAGRGVGSTKPDRHVSEPEPLGDDAAPDRHLPLAEDARADQRAPLVDEAVPDRPAAASPPADATTTHRSPAPERAPGSESAPAAAASGRWLSIVMLLALAGAAALYWQLREIEPTDDGTAMTATRSARTAARSARPRRAATGHHALALDGGADAATDAAIDAADDQLDGSAELADAAVAKPTAPEGMVYVAGSQDSTVPPFFFDRAEVTTSRYQRCVMAGRCVRATRVVLDEQSALAFGGNEGDASTVSLERLAAAWGGRCNARRQALDHPINCVNFGSASDYCAFAHKRLATSAEWTLAAAGAEGRRFPWGDAQPECASACYGLNTTCVGHTSAVASCSGGAHSGDRTPDGIVDLGGNLAEWVSDEAPGAHPSEPPWRVLRGGSFTDEASLMETTTSRAVPAVTAHVTIGFRCALDLAATP